MFLLGNCNIFLEEKGVFCISWLMLIVFGVILPKICFVSSFLGNCILKLQNTTQRFVCFCMGFSLYKKLTSPIRVWKNQLPKRNTPDLQWSNFEIKTPQMTFSVHQVPLAPWWKTTQPYKGEPLTTNRLTTPVSSSKPRCFMGIPVFLVCLMTGCFMKWSPHNLVGLHPL